MDSTDSNSGTRPGEVPPGSEPFEPSDAAPAQRARTFGVINILLAERTPAVGADSDMISEFLGIVNDHAETLAIGELIEGDEIGLSHIRITAEDVADVFEYRVTIAAQGDPAGIFSPRYVLMSEERFGKVVSAPLYNDAGEKVGEVPLTRGGYPVEAIQRVERRPYFPYKEVIL